MERLERYVETFFRHKWFFLCVLVFVPLVGTGMAIKQQEVLYVASSTVWAEKPVYFDVTNDWNAYLTPAQNQAGNVSELLHTDDFAMRVASQTELRRSLLAKDSSQQTLDKMRKRVSVLPIDKHLIAIRYGDEEPRVAVQVVTAIIASFNTEILDHATGQDAVALTYYQRQLDDANKSLSDVTAALSAYLVAHPELAKLPNSADSALSQLADTTIGLQHPEFVKLVSQRDSAEKAQQRLQGQVDRILEAQSTSSVSQAQSFRVMDPVTLPVRPQRGIRMLALRSGLALVAAIVLAAGALVILTLLDTSLQNEQMAAAHVRLPVLGAVPLLSEQRGLVRRGRIYRRSPLRLLSLQAQGRAMPVAIDPAQ